MTTAPACPNCSSDKTQVIAYAPPGRDIRRGDEPRWRCDACQHSWGRAFAENGRPSALVESPLQRAIPNEERDAAYGYVPYRSLRS